MELQSFMETVKAKNPNEPEFHQAVEEVAMTLIPYINEHPEYEEAKILERMIEPCVREFLLLHTPDVR